MQTITREMLCKKAAELLKNGTVDRVLGWKRGEFSYDVTPAVFTSAEQMERDFVFDPFCGANFSKYLVKEARKGDGRILAFLKPCDTYSFNQLLTEHRIDREKVYVIGVACDGMADIYKLKQIIGDGITGVSRDGDNLLVDTLYDGQKTVPYGECMLERCLCCKSKKMAAYDEIIGEDGDINADNNRFDRVHELEGMSEEQRFDFWRGELSRCIRCNACRDVCPACTCEKCVFDNPESGVENKAISDSFEEKMFHVIRAFHVAGRCTDCGECSRVCPQRIPLHLLNRKFISDIDRLYGDYQAGELEGSRAPLVNYQKDDPEPYEAVEGGAHNA